MLAVLLLVLVLVLAVLMAVVTEHLLAMWCEAMRWTPNLRLTRSRPLA